MKMDQHNKLSAYLSAVPLDLTKKQHQNSQSN